MEIPSPNKLKETNKGKRFAAKEEGETVKLTPEEQLAQKHEKAEKQTAELMEKCVTELQKYRGGTLVVGCKYMVKEAVQNVMQQFADNGMWKVTKGYDGETEEIVLRFKGNE